MHGLLNRSVEHFLRASYGAPLWREVAAEIELREEGFHSFRAYPDELTDRLIVAASHRLGKPQLELLEDLGAWLARIEPVRRLLRFSGSDYSDFVIALEELPGRARMVLPDLALPRITVEVCGPQQFMLRVSAKLHNDRWRAVIAGILRAMSDDYGALALIVDDGAEISVDVSDESFGEARDFDLAARAGLVGGWA